MTRRHCRLHPVAGLTASNMQGCCHHLLTQSRIVQWRLPVYVLGIDISSSSKKQMQCLHHASARRSSTLQVSRIPSAVRSFDRTGHPLITRSALSRQNLQPKMPEQRALACRDPRSAAQCSGVAPSPSRRFTSQPEASAASAALTSLAAAAACSGDGAACRRHHTGTLVERGCGVLACDTYISCAGAPSCSS